MSEQTPEKDHLKAVLTKTLGLDWLGMSGQPDGAEVADDCTEALWAAGVRVPVANPERAQHVVEAQRLLALAESCDWTTPHEPYRDVAIAAAQAHATLAVALSSPPERSGS